MMTCEGFDMGFMGGCGMSWLGAVMLFFLIAFTRKWIGEEMDIPCNLIGGMIGAFLPYMIIVYITCSYKWGLLGGIIGAIVGAFLLGNIIGEDFSI